MKCVSTEYNREQKIYAIKALLQTTGLGLKEAKEAIDNVPTEMNLNGDQIDFLRGYGMNIETDMPPRGPFGKIQIMRNLVIELLEEKQFKPAQYVIDAMEALDEN